MLHRGAKVKKKDVKVLLSGNEAVAEGAIQAGCRFYAGYPITPQNELTAYMARRMPEAGGVFIQAESEVAAINMVMGAAAAGVRAMTSSSSPGISLKQEGISYLAGAELPAVIVNMMRGGPGLGISGLHNRIIFRRRRAAGTEIIIAWCWLLRVCRKRSIPCSPLLIWRIITGCRP
jgi:pyruvate/2-oxoacid:ferredoxin oxidoreductase alpha subunit